MSFDFSKGGAYVAAVRSLQGAPEIAAVRLWVKKPEGMRLVFRYSDAKGQTFQKELPCPGGRWVQAQVNVGDFESHWGGANDGVVRGAPVLIHFLAENRGQAVPVRGDVLLADIRLVPGTAGQLKDLAESEYLAIDFAKEGPWRIDGGGDKAKSRLEKNVLHYDFTANAHWVAAAIDRTLLGEPTQLRLRVRGNAGGHPLKIMMRSHFQMFDYWVGPLKNDGINEIVLSLPPGPKWAHYGGQNDNKLHGPLRLGSIMLEGRGQKDSGQLELLDLRVTGKYPVRKACLLSARVTGEGRQGRFVATLRNLGTSDVPGMLHWDMLEWSGKVVGQGKQAVALPKGGELVEAAVPLPAGDQPFYEARFSFEDAAAMGQVVSPASAYYVQPLPPREDSRTLVPSSPFGMGLYLYRYQWQADSVRGMEHSAALAAAAGVKWTREEFHWAAIEKAKGKFDWSFYDAMVATAKKNGVSVYGILGYWAPWTKPYTDEGIADYCRFAQACAERYKDDVTYWEVWNEPNIFFWQGPKEMYAKLLTQAYAAIKRGNPKAQVMGCSTSEVDTAFIEKTIKLGAPFDVLTVHPYRGVLEDTRYIKELREVAQLVNPAGGKGPQRPVWITEIGWPTHRSAKPNSIDEYYTQTPRQQACLLARCYIDALAAGVANVAWYDFRDDGSDPFYNESNFGLLTRDMKPKPAYRAYATMTRMLHNTKFVEQSEPVKGVTAMVFATEKDRRVTVLWAPQADVEIHLPFGMAAIMTDLMGSQTKLSPKNGKIPLTLRRGCPVFITSAEE